MWPIILIITFILLSGIGDALGFIHSGKVWQGNQFMWREAIKSGLGFQLGVIAFWFALRHLQTVGVVAPETQTVLWFGATIIGVALMSGRFVNWHTLDQIVAIAVLAGIGWLMFRTSG